MNAPALPRPPRVHCGAISLLAVAFLPVATAIAQDSDWHTSGDATFYAYTNRTVLRADSVLNPHNIARLPQAHDTAELRAGFKAESEAVRITGRFIGSTREMRNEFGHTSHSEGYASQWQVRVRAAESWNVAAGRDVLNWGAGQFRSPSSPFYFDNGRTDPLRELTGMDVAKVSWTPDRQHSATVARLMRSAHGAAQTDAWNDGWLAKFDMRSDEIAWGGVVVEAPHLGAFHGAHGQYTVSDELMLYGEWGSSVLPAALDSSPRRDATLAGSSYTFANGQSLMLEYLHDGHGYTEAEQAAYFERAATPFGLPPGPLPRLLGRDYLHAVWQSNLMSEAGYWRLMYTRNLTDHGNEFAAYAETSLHPRLSLYGLAVFPLGSARQEAGDLFTRSVTIGIKSSI